MVKTVILRFVSDGALIEYSRTEPRKPSPLIHDQSIIFCDVEGLCARFLLGRLVIFNLMERESPPDQPVAVEEAPVFEGAGQGAGAEVQQEDGNISEYSDGKFGRARS